MPFNSGTFRQSLSRGGARPNMFEIKIIKSHTMDQSVFDSTVGDSITMLANSGDMPGSIIGTIPVPYFGRFINVAGDRMFEDWSCGIYCDEDFKTRNAFEKWNNALAFLNYETNKEHGKNAETIDKYVCTVQISHYTKTGVVDKIYTLHNAFPYVVSPVQLSWQANDQIMIFEVTWKYDYFTTNFSNFTGAGITENDVKASSNEQ